MRFAHLAESILQYRAYSCPATRLACRRSAMRRCRPTLDRVRRPQRRAVAPNDHRGTDGTIRWHSNRRRRRPRRHRAGRPAASSICARASRPITDCSSRTEIRIGMRSHRGTQRIIGAVGIGHPIAQGLIDGGAQSFIAACHRHHGGPQQLHAIHIGCLPLDIDRAHVHHAGHSEPCGRCRACHPVLAGAGFRDDALGSQALCQQRLPDGVVDLMRAGMRQVLAFQPDLRTPRLLKVGAGDNAVGRPTQSSSSRLNSA